VEAVATGDEVAGDFMGFAVFFEIDFGVRVVEVTHSDLFRFEDHLAAGGCARVVEVFQHLMLRVDGDGFAGKFLEIEPMAAAAEAEFDAVVYQTFALHSFSNAHLREQVNGALLEDSGPHALLGVLAAAVFDHDGIDAAEIEEMGKDEAGRASAYDT